MTTNFQKLKDRIPSFKEVSYKIKNCRPSRQTVQLLAFILVSMVFAYGFSRGKANQSSIVSATERVARISCKADRQNAILIRGILDRQIEFVKRSNEPPPPTTEERVKNLIDQKATIMIPDCDERLSELRKLK